MNFEKYALACTEKQTYSLPPVTNVADLERLVLTADSDKKIVVNERSALTSVTVKFCIETIAETIANLPLDVFKKERLADGRTKRIKQDNHPIDLLLNRSPDDVMGGMDFRSGVMTCLLLYGNAYAEIERDGKGNPIAFHLLDPSKVRPEWVYYFEKSNNANLRRKYEIVYRCNGNNNQFDIPQQDMLHWKAFSTNGLVGISPVEAARQCIELGLTLDKFAQNTFANGVNQSGILVHPSKLEPKAREKLREELLDVHGGLNNSHKFLFLQEGMQFIPTQMPNDQSQFLGSRHFQQILLGMIWRLPKHMVGEGTSYNNVEQEGLNFLKYCIGPWCKRFEVEINRKCFSKTDWGNIYVEHNTAKFLQADELNKWQVYKIQKELAVRSSNDIAELENILPHEGGDDYGAPVAGQGYSGAAPGSPAPATDAPVQPIAPEQPATDEPISRLPINDLVGALPHPIALAQAIAAGTISKQTAILQLVIQLGWSEEQARAWVDSLPDAKTQETVIASLRQEVDQLKNLLFSQVWKRFKTKETEAILRATNKIDFKEIVKDFYATHRQQLVEALEPIAEIVGLVNVDEYCDSRLEKLLSIDQIDRDRVKQILETN